MSNTKPAVKEKEETALALPDGYMETFPEGHDEADHILPVMSIIQPTAGSDKKATGKEGDFVSRDGTVYETLRFVLISVQYGRGKKKKFEGHGSNNGGSMWLCSSDDRRMGLMQEPTAILSKDQRGEMGVSDDNEPIYLACADCPLQGDEKNWVKDGCRYKYTLRCFDLVAQRPFAYFVSGKAMAPIRAAIVDRVTPRRAPNKSIIPPEKLFWWAELEFTTQHHEDKGSYYLPVPRVVMEFDATEAAHFSQLYTRVREAAIEEPEDEEEGQGSFEA